MDRLTANRYISLQQKISNSGGGVPQEIIDDVEALDATVNGDETQDPPVVGLVDIVGDLENSVEDLDTTVNGDPTAEPPVPPLLAGAGNMRISNAWTNSTPTSTFAAQDIDLGTSDYDSYILVYRMKTNIDYLKSVFVPKGGAAYLDMGYFTSADNQVIYYRSVITSDDDTLHVYGGSKAGNSSESSDNTVCIPVAVYLVKFMSN